MSDETHNQTEGSQMVLIVDNVGIYFPDQMALLDYLAGIGYYSHIELIDRVTWRLHR